MTLTSICPHCQNKNEHSINLEYLSDKFKEVKFDDHLILDDLEFFLKPQTFEQVNKGNIEKFEQQRILSLVADNDMPLENKQKEFNKLFLRILDLTVEQVSLSIVAIKLKDGRIIENRVYINEFMKNCDKTIWNAIKNKITDMSSYNPLQNINLECEEEKCKKPYDAPLIFENSNFFG
jgi:hypothetical protein